ncbi:VOC family protein [Hoeflea sp. WL0058]|uniref:VOC family protein n=1 Tax=Flavimaribacter sediminis TaxID=2865987 RepID=A0AAE2ZL03_9HYPH|nr:VOC family protein [Flavimaribacter sediminis]MBW8638463.1 VOC family protein [Flavimaribacter sediminis]
MAINALGYIGIRSDCLTDWTEFASKILGMQSIERSRSARAFRMDNREQRLLVTDEPGETLAFIGWEVDSPEDIEMYAARLDAAGVAVDWGSPGLADKRFVSKLVGFDDPDGNRVELFHGPMLADDPFAPGRPIQGFKTGPYGMGHAVMHVTDPDRMLGFYRDLLDFRVSDYGLTPYPLYFFHVNGRHHSFALVGSGQTGFHHFMVEFDNLDDVGQGYDLAQMDPECIAYTLGRHTNDYMTSYYAHTPSGFFIESGWGGRIIDPDTWNPHETTCGPSFWGHERLYLPDDARERMRDMRLEAAQNGLRAPPVIDCPWLYGALSSKSKAAKS